MILDGCREVIVELKEGGKNGSNIYKKVKRLKKKEGSINKSEEERREKKEIT